MPNDIDPEDDNHEDDIIEDDEIDIEDAEIDPTNPDDLEDLAIDEPLDDGPVVKVKKKKTKEFYVNEKEFEDALRSYYDTNIMKTELIDMIRKMINGLAHRPNFINYTFRDEATGDALVNIMAALHKKKYKFGGSKPFSYFNAIAWNCWRNRIKKEARQRHALAAFQEESYGEMVHKSGATAED